MWHDDRRNTPVACPSPPEGAPGEGSPGLRGRVNSAGWILAGPSPSRSGSTQVTTRSRKPLATTNVQLVVRPGADAGRVHRPAGDRYDFPWPECRSYPATPTRTAVPTYRITPLAVTCVRCEVQQLTEQAIAAARARGDTAVVVPAGSARNGR
jgi:hypothetical protein